MLPQNTLSHAHKMKLRWFVTLSTLPLLGVVTAFGIMPQTDSGLRNQKTVLEDITLPKFASAKPSATTFWHNERIQRGDTIAELLRRLNVDDQAASDYLRKSRAAAGLRQLAAGREVQAETDANGALLALRFLDNGTSQVVIERSGDDFKKRELPAVTEQRVLIRTGEIKSSLYAATDEADLPDPAANQLAEIFGGDIDFHRDLRKGDSFTVVYEMSYVNGESVRTGRIQSAEFVNQGRTYRAAWFQTTEFTGDYYSPDGKSMRKAFLRSPIEFSRVSSGFSRSRFHPVLNKWRAHKGVDYAAPIGTKVRATSDGVVSFVGKQGGYGNVVKVNHQGNFTTVYGHLSRFAGGIKKGQRLGQGQIVGYVGMTGLTSGPHLHYEFQHGGVQRDPLKVALPDGKPVPPGLMETFTEITRDQFARLDMLRHTRIAKLD
ncbi:MAG: peptidoglycan DD-metalloendopeptidase family protein [Gammaproteobacteria bacterium]|nr:peptidoglycan DD-metalloendopeptidase family protein [Gammaproteobacteria bacterium]MBU1777932.1 peptidoglycan DD-metalloendopeptidase family protein [Gammaproteobacteria bacterium]MBU1969481.1 peptidoglycan DD-metalloendopeptidase family protein [Gammaproteobacteria bacterium]